MIRALDHLAADAYIADRRHKHKNDEDMNQVMIDIWPYLFGSMLAVIGWLFRQVFKLKADLESTKKELDSLKATMQNSIENIEKTIENVQKRMDSHSKKQDEFLEKMTSMEKEMLKSIGSVRADIASLSSALKGLSDLILVSDQGVKINRQ